MFIIDKIFNLKIDTKNKNVSTVTGLKQFDNNSILNITLLQNSLALDLSNCTVRINFLREDTRVLLYMADVVSAREGKVSIKLSPEVLEKYGLIKADISVFDSNLLKITSTTFNMKVDKTIYNDTYFTDKDLDLMQQEYVREKERQSNENNRKSNESNRTQAETKRGQNENTRISNEEDRKKAEDTRVSEWNNVKKDANNIKNTLDTTIDTANKSNSDLQNTINNADKLKQELTPQNYVKNSDYEAYKKEANSQYEDIEKQLKNSSTKTITKNSNILNLENSVEGIVNIQIEGNTLYKRKNNTYTEKWEEGCTLDSVGKKEKQVVVKSIGKNLIDLNKIVSGRIDNGKLGYIKDCEFIIKDNKIILTTKNNTWRGITTEYFQVESNKNYSFSFKQPDDTFAIAIHYYDNAKNFISKNELINSKTITTPDKTAYAKITFIVENIGIHSIENIQFEEGSKATKFEPYKEDKIAISLKEPLRSLPNGVRDTINTDGTITRRVGKVTITESNKWYRNEEWDSNSFIAFYCTIDNCAEEPNHTVNIINDTFASYSVDKITKEILYNGGICLSPAKLLSVVILKEKLETQDVDGFKKWIKKNPITVYYKLKKPIVESIVESIGQPLNLKMFKDRYIVADTEVIPYINVEYPTNLNSRISTMEEAEKFIKDSLGGAWKTLLMLADKDLKMKSINPLKTTTAEDLKNKINEMLGAWK